MQSVSTQVAAIFEKQKSSSSNPVANEVFEEILSSDLESSGPSGSETERKKKMTCSVNHPTKTLSKLLE